MKLLKKILFKFGEHCLLKGTLGKYSGIRICDINLDDSDDQIFLEWTHDALELIRKKSRKLFGRIQKELKYITNQELCSGGRYVNSFHSCDIDFSKYNHPGEHYDYYFYSMVMTIIHEATHGYLESKGIPYNQRTRIRVEKICFREGRNFIRKLNVPVGDSLIERYHFDINFYDFYWHLSRWERLKFLLNRIREIKQKQQAGIC